MEFCYKLICKQDSLILTELFVDSVNEDNGNVWRSFATSVNELMMTASCYKNRVDACLAIWSEKLIMTSFDNNEKKVCLLLRR